MPPLQADQRRSVTRWPASLRRPAGFMIGIQLVSANAGSSQTGAYPGSAFRERLRHADRTRASWQPYGNETQYLLTTTAHKRISTIAFHLAALAKRNALSADWP